MTGPVTGASTGPRPAGAGPAAPGVAGRTREPRRRPGVDAVRGLALLGSAVGTAVLWLHGRQLGPGYRPTGAEPADRAVDLVTALLVDNRVLPVFALLLGWALAVRLRPGRWQGVVVRAAVLLGLGAAHALLLQEADVLGTLAVLLVVGVPLVAARLRTQLLLALLVLPALVLHGAADGLGGTAGFPDPPTDYLRSVVDRWGTWLLGLVLLPFLQLGLLIPLLAGARLARAGWLHDPASHRRGLLLLGAPCSVLGLVGALPYALVVSAGGQGEALDAVVAGVLSSLTGPAAAVGAVCLAVLLLSTAGGRSPGVAALAALGRHSLPVYLVHSLVLALVLAPWAAGLGGRWGSAAAVLLATGLWLGSVGLAAVVHDRRDPVAPATADPGSAQPSERQGRDLSSAT